MGCAHRPSSRSSVTSKPPGRAATCARAPPPRHAPPLVSGTCLPGHGGWARSAPAGAAPPAAGWRAAGAPTSVPTAAPGVGWWCIGARGSSLRHTLRSVRARTPGARHPSPRWYSMPRRARTMGTNSTPCVAAMSEAAGKPDRVDRVSQLYHHASWFILLRPTSSGPLNCQQKPRLACTSEGAAGGGTWAGMCKSAAQAAAPADTPTSPPTPSTHRGGEALGARVLVPQDRGRRGGGEAALRGHARA